MVPDRLPYGRGDSRASSNQPLIGASVALAEWRKAENKSACAPLAFTADGDANGRPRRANFFGGWAVAFDLPNRRSAYGVAGTGGPMGVSDADLRKWPHIKQYDEKSFLGAGSTAGYGLSGNKEYSASNPDGVGEESLAYLKVEGQGCLYNVWSQLGTRHLEFLLDHLKLIEH
jgi:hypothetical protein